MTEFEFDHALLEGTTATCLDCRHWCPAAGCAMAGDPAVDAFTDPYRYPQDADMSHCPGFCEVE